MAFINETMGTGSGVSLKNDLDYEQRTTRPLFGTADMQPSEEEAGGGVCAFDGGC